MGEFIAFTIGWNLILEYVIGTASVAKGMALYIDSLTNKTMENTMKEVAPISVSFLAEYPDFFAFGLVAVITGKSNAFLPKVHSCGLPTTYEAELVLGC